METLRYVVLVNGLLAAISLVYYVLLRHETYFKANRLALWAGLTCAFIFPLIELPDWRPQPVRRAMQQTAQVIVPRVLPRSQLPSADVTITFPNKKTYKAFRVEPEKSIWSWQVILIALYISITFLLLVRFTIQLASLRKLITHSVQDIYYDFVLVQNQGVTSPFSFFSWVVVNPGQHTSEELDQILRHERVHVREWHSLDMIVAELLCIVFWFNPTAYLFRHLIHQVLEFNADQAVLAEGVNPLTYQYNLVKVSLSAGQSPISNHFSRSQLKSRIAMLNQQKSSKASWLKYPGFFIIPLTIASAFAHPQHIKNLSRYVPKPVEKTTASVTKPTNERLQSIDNKAAKQPTVLKLTQQENTKDNAPKSSIQESSRQLDYTNQLSKPDTTRKSPSRYMVYQGDYLYWIVTPKTTFDDFAIMKREFEKHGYKMNIQTLIYDPLDAYISDIKVTIIRPTAGVSDFEETGVSGAPIRSYGGYNGFNTMKTVAAVGSYPFNNNFLHIPLRLVQIARDEELPATKLIEDKKMEELIAVGQRKYGHLGIGFRKFDKEDIIKQSTPNSSLSVTPDGSLTINEIPGHWVVKAFINNEPVTLDEVRKLRISQIYTFAVVLGYDSTLQKRSGTDYFFFYVN